MSEISKLKQFNSFTPKGISSNRWLKKSFQLAQKLRPPVSVEYFTEANSKLLLKLQKTKKRQREPEPSETEIFEAKILNLHNMLDKKIISSLKKTESPETPNHNDHSKMVRKIQLLNAFTMSSLSPQNLKKYSTETITKHFEKMLSVTLSKQLFNSTKIIRSIRYFYGKTIVKIIFCIENSSCSVFLTF